jgi:glycosyl transferase, family 25
MWPCYVINLAANAKRMQNSAAALAAQGLEFERIEGVNGWALSEDDVAKAYDRDKNRARGKHPLVRPEIGCYLSHIECWKKIAAGAAPGGIVFEDDFNASAELKPILAGICADTGGDWDIVKLFSFDHDPKAVAGRRLGGNFEIVFPYRVPTCLIGYALTRMAAKRLAANAVPFFRPVDEDMKFFWETGLKVALVLPPPVSVGDQEAATGTIGNERRQARRENRMLHSLLYQLRYSANLHYHRFMGTGG